MFGTRSAMVELCDRVVAALAGPTSSCWDQGMFNVLAIAAATEVTFEAKPVTAFLAASCFSKDEEKTTNKTRQLESLQLTRSVCLTSIEGKINSKEKNSIRLNRTHGLKNRTKLVCPTIHVFHCRPA